MMMMQRLTEEVEVSYGAEGVVAVFQYKMQLDDFTGSKYGFGDFARRNLPSDTIQIPIVAIYIQSEQFFFAIGDHESVKEMFDIGLAKDVFDNQDKGDVIGGKARRLLGVGGFFVKEYDRGKLANLRSFYHELFKNGEETLLVIESLNSQLEEQIRLARSRLVDLPDQEDDEARMLVTLLKQKLPKDPWQIGFGDLCGSPSFKTVFSQMDDIVIHTIFGKGETLKTVDDLRVHLVNTYGYQSDVLCTKVNLSHDSDVQLLRSAEIDPTTSGGKKQVSKVAKRQAKERKQKIGELKDFMRRTTPGSPQYREVEDRLRDVAGADFSKHSAEVVKDRRDAAVRGNAILLKNKDQVAYVLKKKISGHLATHPLLKQEVDEAVGHFLFVEVVEQDWSGEEKLLGEIKAELAYSDQPRLRPTIYPSAIDWYLSGDPSAADAKLYHVQTKGNAFNRSIVLRGQLGLAQAVDKNKVDKIIKRMKGGDLKNIVGRANNPTFNMFRSVIRVLKGARLLTDEAKGKDIDSLVYYLLLYPFKMTEFMQGELIRGRVQGVDIASNRIKMINVKDKRAAGFLKQAFSSGGTVSRVTTMGKYPSILELVSSKLADAMVNKSMGEYEFGVPPAQLGFAALDQQRREFEDYLKKRRDALINKMFKKVAPDAVRAAVATLKKQAPVVSRHHLRSRFGLR